MFFSRNEICHSALFGACNNCALIWLSLALEQDGFRTNYWVSTATDKLCYTNATLYTFNKEFWPYRPNQKKNTFILLEWCTFFFKAVLFFNTRKSYITMVQLHPSDKVRKSIVWKLKPAGTMHVIYGQLCLNRDTSKFTKCPQPCLDYNCFIWIYQTLWAWTYYSRSIFC